MSVLTKEELKESLLYDKKTGDFFWVKKSNNQVKDGSIAGYITAQGYREICLSGVSYKAHRLAWLYVYSEMPIDQIDHINHIRDDNRIVNLRQATNKANHRNRTLQANNTTGISGIVSYKNGFRWKAQIKVNQVFIYLGLFADRFDAICARKSAENRYGFHANHGERIK